MARNSDLSRHKPCKFGLGNWVFIGSISLPADLFVWDQGNYGGEWLAHSGSLILASSPLSEMLEECVLRFQLM